MIAIVAYALLVPILAVAAWADVRTGKVPNRLTYPAVLAGLAVWSVGGLVTGGLGGGWTGLLWSLGGFSAGFFPFLILSMMGGLGGGDVKLMAAVGALSADWRVVLATSVYALLLAFLMALVLMVRHRLVLRTLTRIMQAALLSAHRLTPTLPGDSPKIPFALAVALGGAVAGAEGMLGLHTPWASLGP